MNTAVPRDDGCAFRAEQRGDPMLGTAFPAARILLIEQPGPWGRRGLRDSRFGPHADAVERRANAAGLRVETIRSPARQRDAGSELRWAVVDTRHGRESIRWGSYSSPADLLELPLDQAVGEPDDQPLYLVCTHGKHDRCCAVRGRPVAAALHALRPGRVWECSHVGGDRFAANVLTLPGGVLHGRVRPGDAAAIVAATDADEVLPQRFRGRVGLPPAAQAALALGHEHFATARRSDLAVTGIGAVEGGLTTVRLRGPHGDFEVDVAVERVAADGLTCGEPGPNRFVRYRPLMVRASARP